MAEIDFRKEYLPGYTGHVPKKMEVFGCTAGEANKIIIETARRSLGINGADPRESAYMTNGRSIAHAKRTLYSHQPPKDDKGEVIQYGNVSRLGHNWIGGPTQNLKAQYVPGYQGFVPGIKAENLYGKSFAKGSSKAINKEYERGFDLPTHQRFLSQNAIEHDKTNFRRIREAEDPADAKDFANTLNFSDAE